MKYKNMYAYSHTVFHIHACKSVCPSVGNCAAPVPRSHNELKFDPAPLYAFQQVTYANRHIHASVYILQLGYPAYFFT